MCDVGRYLALREAYDKSRDALADRTRAINGLVEEWYEMGSLFQESHPDIRAWYVKFAAELEDTFRGARRGAGAAKVEH